MSGGEYEYSASSGIYRYGYVKSLSDNGQSIGSTSRYSPSGGYLGGDVWLIRGTSTQLLGLSGSGYQYVANGLLHRYSRPERLNNAGQAIGVSDRHSASGGGLGQDAWFFDGNTTRLMGLTGSGYDAVHSVGVERYAYPGQFNEAGQATGYNLRLAVSGGEYLGYDAWFFNGTSTQLIGLTGSGYEYAASGGIFRQMSGEGHNFNEAGHVSGPSYRYSAQGDDLGLDAWFFNGTSTQLIGLTGSGYEYAASGGIARTSSITRLNEQGQAIGQTNRYSASGENLGVSGWFYDSDTGITTPLEFSVNVQNYSVTTPSILTEQGVVLGLYERQDPDDFGPRAFWWSTEAGFHDLGELVNVGLTAAGWESLEFPIQASGSTGGGTPSYIVGGGVAIGVDPQSANLFLLAAAGVTGDYNGDGVVNATDYTVWRDNLNAPTLPFNRDPNNGGAVGQADYVVWKANFSASSENTSAAVPEPSAVMLALFAIAVVAVFYCNSRKWNA